MLNVPIMLFNLQLKLSFKIFFANLLNFVWRVAGRTWRAGASSSPATSSCTLTSRCTFKFWFSYQNETVANFVHSGFVENKIHFENSQYHLLFSFCNTQDFYFIFQLREDDFLFRCFRVQISVTPADVENLIFMRKTLKKKQLEIGSRSC